MSNFRCEIPVYRSVRTINNVKLKTENWKLRCPRCGLFEYVFEENTFVFNFQLSIFNFVRQHDKLEFVFQPLLIKIAEMQMHFGNFLLG